MTQPFVHLLASFLQETYMLEKIGSLQGEGHSKQETVLELKALY
jgi:hypothetical protein